MEYTKSELSFYITIDYFKNIEICESEKLKDLNDLILLKPYTIHSFLDLSDYIIENTVVFVDRKSKIYILKETDDDYSYFTLNEINNIKNNCKIKEIKIY
jgi:hypothetical protein